MASVIVKVKYPPHIAENFLKFYLSGKAPKYPDYVKRIHQFTYSDYLIKVINIYEIPDDKLYEGMKGIAKRFSAYTSFEGYVYKIKIVMEASEALELLK